MVDYGAGNIRSVFNGFIRVGNPVNIVNTPEEIEESELLVIPGVGAFNDGMKGLKKRKLINPIIEHVNNNKPIIGICLGMQLLMSDSEEFGFNEGLDIIKGSVVRFKDPSLVNIKGYVVPQIGWNSIKLNKTHEWDGSILKNIPDFSDVYFVHSFYPIIEEKELIQAETIYGNQKFCSSFRKNNVYGTQFHPEKSGEIGLQILDNFGQL
ncbi:MAG: imidazole glycerol phosphate synthase subunit HisH [Candidatus Helarchaeota archaeon]